LNWRDFEPLWKRQPPPLGAEANLADLQATFAVQHRQLATTLLVRDWAEAGAGLLGCIVLALIWRKLGVAGWPIGLAMGLILGISAVYIYQRLQSRKLWDDASASMLAQVEADLAVLRQQRRLLAMIWLWYLGPILAAILIVHFTFVLQTPSWNPLRDPVFGAGFVGFYVLCIGFVWFINRQTGRKQLEPRIAELEKLRSAEL
jgi:protein-S-isoprenylcysteine O-methyltransferase Ste14